MDLSIEWPAKVHCQSRGTHSFLVLEKCPVSYTYYAIKAIYIYSLSGIKKEKLPLGVPNNVHFKE